jgi:hypothetical protein
VDKLVCNKNGHNMNVVVHSFVIPLREQEMCSQRNVLIESEESLFLFKERMM